MTLFGWTMQQWAIVLAAYPLQSADEDGVIASAEQWCSSRNYHPGDEKLSMPATDFGAVETIMHLPWQGDKVPPAPERTLIVRAL